MDVNRRLRIVRRQNRKLGKALFKRVKTVERLKRLISRMDRGLSNTP